MTNGSNVLDSDLKVKTTSGSLNSYIRARVDYQVNSGVSGDSFTNAQKMVIALNSIEAKSGGYQVESDWQYNASDDCYYLTSGSSTTNLLSVTAGTDYTLFKQNSLLFPNVEDFKLDLGKERIDTVLNNVALIITFEAVQSENTNITTIAELAQEMPKLFKDTETTKGYMVTYNSQGGKELNSTIIIGNTPTTLTLPQVNGINVEWYSSTDFSASNKVGESGVSVEVNSNLDLYAKYKESGLFYVFFETNGATSGSMPQTMSITYSASGCTVSSAYSADLAKSGYELGGFKVKGENTTLSYNSTDRTITIPNNLSKARSAVTIIPIWTNVSYTATFMLNGGTITSSTTDLTAITNGYTLNYTVSDSITFPTITKESKATIGWEVQETIGKWRKNDIYTSGQLTSGYYGNVTFKAIFGSISQLIADQSITLSQNTFTYDTTEHKPEVTVKTESGTNLSGGIDYELEYSNNINAGTATVRVKGLGAYEGYKDIPYTINRKDIAGATINLGNTLIYNGATQTQNVSSVVIGSLNVPTYTVTNNTGKDANTYTLTVTASGNFTGKQTRQFSISTRAVTITAKPQTVNGGVIITKSTNQVTADNLASGHSVQSVTLKQSSTTDNGTITASNAIIVDSSANEVNSNYTITYETGVLTVNCDWTLTFDDTTLTATITKYKGTGTTPTVPTTFYGVSEQEYNVTALGSSAFSSNKNITTVTVPNSIASIGDYCFNYCSKLESITIPSSVTSIGESCFSGCSALESITIPSSVTILYYRTFEDCTSLKTVSLPTTLKTIYRWCFEGCTALKSITIPSGVTELDVSIFVDCISLSSVSLPSTLKTIGSGCFSHCKALTSITIPSGVTELDSSVFEYCTSLSRVSLPSTLKTIGYDCFENCTSLTSITIPSSVTSMGSGVFSYCAKLATIVVNSSNTKYDSRNSCNAIIETSSNTLIAGCKNTIIPSTVTKIDMEAFQGSGITSINIPASVTYIGSVGGGTGGGTFRDCDSLTTITVSSSNSVYDSRNSCNAIIETSTNKLIAGCKNSTIPSTVTAIGQDAFMYCNGLTSITIPSSVISIGEKAFWGCENLASATFKTTSGWTVTDTWDNVTSLSSSNLSNAATAAKYLRSTYNSSTWTRS